MRVDGAGRVPSYRYVIRVHGQQRLQLRHLLPRKRLYGARLGRFGLENRRAVARDLRAGEREIFDQRSQGAEELARRETDMHTAMTSGAHSGAHSRAERVL